MSLSAVAKLHHSARTVALNLSNGMDFLHRCNDVLRYGEYALAGMSEDHRRAASFDQLHPKPLPLTAVAR